jgi:hypothetical protein
MPLPVMLGVAVQGVRRGDLVGLGECRLVRRCPSEVHLPDAEYGWDGGWLAVGDPTEDFPLPRPYRLPEHILDEP